MEAAIRGDESINVARLVIQLPEEECRWPLNQLYRKREEEENGITWDYPPQEGK